MKEYDNFSKLDSNFNKGMSKAGSMMSSALGTAMLNKHN